MEYNENDTDTESDEEEGNEIESSGSDEDESGDDDEGSDYESVEEIIETVPEEGAGNAEGSNAFSSDDDPERENCPICLNKFIGQDLGSPESCDHTFCFECIKEWSKNINTCPIDRTEFNYIHVKVHSSGAVLRKVQVKVAPKEPENALEETPTLCEICHSGDREDRLLLCDGCDLAYHCECLDPPLFYIPIEEWFCPSCSGVFDSRAVAGPSRSRTRRVIPRTRASEAVRSRMQNLQSIRAPRSPSTSVFKKTTTQSKPKKRKRRYYRKAIRKVVTLARTKKDMTGQKGKLGTRNTTVIVTYRRRRCRRKAKRKASSKNTVIPSSKQRIAKHLGIGKPLNGTTVPQIKKSSGSGSRSTSVKARLPSHSLFGNKDQLMDFCENFNEDMRDASSTSSSKSPKRSSVESCPSTSSGLSILDSIIAGQKILHAKPDKILIKTDGSLILKEETKKESNVGKTEKDPPSRTPMSIALAKQGVRTSLPDKKLNTACKKHADSTKTKNVSGKIILNSSTDTKTENKLSCFKIPTKSSSKLFTILNNDVKSSINMDIKNSSSTINGLGIKSRKDFASDDGDSADEMDGFLNDISSNKETVVTNSTKTNHLSIASKGKNQNNLKLEKGNNSDKIYQTKFDSLSNNFNTTMSSSSSVSFASVESFVKREVQSDDETDDNSAVNNVVKVHIKQEILSDEDTNIDSWDNHTDNKEQEYNNILTNIKKEPIDTNCNVNTVKDNNVGINKNISYESSHENSLSDIDASQSIIDSVPYDTLNASQINKPSKNSKLLKVKKEISSDSEDYSQSLLLDSGSENLLRSSELKKLTIKKEPFDSNDVRNSENENVRHNKKGNFIESLKSRNTAFSSQNVHNSSEKEFCDELPSTQAVAPLPNSESEDDDLPCTQALLGAVSADSEEDISCTQAFPGGPASDLGSDSEDDEIPCGQIPPEVPASDSEDDEISHPQTSPHVESDSENENLPCTQAVFNVSRNPVEDIQCAQAAPASAPANLEEDNDDEDMPCTQVVFISKNSNTKSNSLSHFDADELSSNKITDNSLPPTQSVLYVSKNADTNDSVFNSKKDFEFKKPSAFPRKEVTGTDNNNVSNKKRSRISSTSTLSESELPPTQIVTFSAPVSNKRNKSSNFVSGNLKFNNTSDQRHNFDLDDDSLPLTQVSDSSPKQLANDILFDTSNKNSNLKIVNSATPVCNSNSPNIMPKGKIFNDDTEKLSNSKLSSPSETLDLPPTQISNISVNGQNISSSDTLSHGNFQISDNDNEQNPIPDTQVLLDTQSTCPVSKELSLVNTDDEQDNNLCKKDMNEIISNIKQLVNNLSSKVLENPNLQNISNEISNNVSSSNSRNTSNDCLNQNELVDFKDLSSTEKSTVANNSKIILPESSNKLSSTNAEKENQSNVQSSDDSDTEEFSLEKLKESLKKPKPATPKKTGIHKHLPQVIATVPVKENLKIKPSNKRTFSFEEVKKLQESNEPQKPSENVSSKFKISDNKLLENCKNDLNDSNDSLPATQAIETFDDKLCKSNLLQSKNDNLEVKNQLTNQELTKIQENEDFPATQSTFSDIKEKELVSSKFHMSKNTDSSIDIIDLDDLPATQVCNNPIPINANRLQRLSNNSAELDSMKIQQNNASKRKNSLNEIIKNKKICNQITDKLYSKRSSVKSEIIDDHKESYSMQKITIKQEKDEFAKLLTNMQIFNSSTPASCLNVNVKIEKVDPFDDFLPPTQAVNLNLPEDDSLPQTQVNNINFVDIKHNISKQNDLKSTQNNFISSCQIKKEPCSDDDEVSVIELDPSPNASIKEVIFIDDDDKNSDLLKCNVQHREKVPSEMVDISCIKKEKCLESNISSESDMKSLNIISEKSKNSNPKCSKDYKKKDYESAKSKHDYQNSKDVESKKSKRNLVESGTSNKDVKISKDLQGTKSSTDQHTSKEKSKRNSKDHKISEKGKGTLKEFPLFKEGIDTVKGTHELKKKSSSSNNIKSSKKDVKDSDNSQITHEKDRKKLKDPSSKEEKQSDSSFISKKKKEEVNKGESKASALKDKEKMDKSASKSTNSASKSSMKSKDFSNKKDTSNKTNNQCDKNSMEKDKQKHSEIHSNKLSKELILEGKSVKSSEKQRRCSSEKENRNNKEVIITLKSTSKRPHDDNADKYNQKKRKLSHSLDSESNSSEDLVIQLNNLQNDFHKYSLNGNMHLECDGISNGHSTTKDIKHAHEVSNELFSKPVLATDIKKIHSKQDLKEEIAKEVKLVLKPFYSTGLISKDDYKDIMRRAVPKIFMNCHNLINPEKIRKLVLNYVSLLSNKS